MVSDWAGKLRDSTWGAVVVMLLAIGVGTYIFLTAGKAEPTRPPPTVQHYVVLSIRHPETKDVLLQFRGDLEKAPAVGNEGWLNSVFYVQDRAQSWTDSVYAEYKKGVVN